MNETNNSLQKYLVCDKCGHVHPTAGFYAKREGKRCGVAVGTNPAKASGGTIYCQAKLVRVIEAENMKAAKDYAKNGTPLRIVLRNE